MAYSRTYPAPPQPYNSASPIGASRSVQQAPSALPPVAIPPGTLPPGTIVNVGEYQVVVERFLSEGGFAHVYLAKSSIPLPVGSPIATTKHVLKRMAVPDKRGVHEVGKEVEVMRQLKNHPKIVNMIEASVADLPGGVDGSKGYEIYILMEWCAGGGIIDMMNTRLQNRMTESEILKIFADTVEAVAHMHYQSPPLIHRDLKVENILLTPPQTYKLCDFGSTTKPLSRDKVPTAVEGIQKIELEINKTTTLQYRAPELVDVWGRKGFDEKIDIWALGVLLYKLCYYTTPFEEHGPLAILNAQYKFPPYPAYSPQIRSLVSSMLQERPENRPNIYQVHEMTCHLRGVSVRIENKYAMSSSSTGGLRAQANPLPARPASAQPPAAPTANILSSNSQASSSTPNLTQLSGMQGLASQVSPMRRGRPGKNGGGIGGSKDGWAAFASPDQDQATKSPMSNGGFGDAFVPTKTDIAQSKSPELPLETQVEMPQNMGMFQDLISPKPEVQSRADQEKKAKEEDDERKKFESTFPALMDDNLAPFGPRNPSAATQPPQLSQPPQQPSVSPLPPLSSPKPMPFQVTGEDAGPPLPRRPPTASQAPPSSSAPSEAPPSTLAPSSNRPLLVERGSQTSPHLLASWKNGSTGANSTSNGSQPPPTSASNGRSGLRQSSIPEFDLSSPSEPSPSKPPAFDLLGDDGDSTLDSFAPGTVPLPASPRPDSLPKSPTLPPKPSFENSVARKQASFLSPSPGPQVESKEREKFRPIRKSMAGPLESEGGKTEGKVESEADVEERFPAIPDSATATAASVDARKEFEEVVERNEDGPDSSDDETPTPVPSSKVDKPSFSDDDDDFAPRPIRQKAATAPVRPKFGTKPSSQSSLAASTNRMSLAASPTPLETRSTSTESLPTTLNRPYRSSTMDSVASSEGGGQGDIDLGPALASIRKFAPSNNDRPHSILDEQDEDDQFLPSTKTAMTLSSAPYSAGPTSTLPPLTSSTPSIATPVLNTISPTPPTGFVPTRPTSAQSPLLTPKPRKPAGINSLVSRYEGLGTSLTGGPPPIGSKPVGLRKDSTGSNTSLVRDAVNPRPRPSRGVSNTSNGASHADPPSQPNLDQRFESPSFPSLPPKSSTPTQYNHGQPSSRVPFKPVPPPSSPQTSRSRYSLAGPPPSFDSNASVEKGEEEEEKFAGVRNMKSRWESMSKPREGDGGSQGRGADKRKSWAAI